MNRKYFQAVSVDQIVYLIHVLVPMRMQKTTKLLFKTSLFLVKNCLTGNYQNYPTDNYQIVVSWQLSETESGPFHRGAILGLYGVFFVSSFSFFRQ